MALALAILGAIPAIYGLITFFKKMTEHSPAEKAIEVLADVEAAMEKAKKNDDTSDIEKLINR